jgi:cytokinin dehydrogenase
VLRPGSVKDIVKMVRFARKHYLKVAARGQGHSTYGQPQVDAGVVVDMNGLSTIHSIAADRADVDAGVLWSSLLVETLKQGLTPPVLTDYIELSVGGTLSVGGIGGTSHRYGVQADNVLELQVVTGEGKLERCSPTRNRDLFEVVLAGLGQCGLIVRATVRLIPAQTNARVFLLFYSDLATFTDDQQALIVDERFNYVEGQIVSSPGGGWQYMLEAASFWTPPAAPDNAALLSGLSDIRDLAQIEDRSYFDFANRLAPVVAFLKSIGVWYFPHPWFDVFVPGSKVNGYVGDIVASLTLADTGQGPVLLYPVKRERFTMPLFRVPDEPVTFLFDILRTAPPDPNVVAAMVASNRELFERDRDLGGNRYAIGAIPFSPDDWRQHFGSAWETLVQAKHRYDPDNILTPGQNIF